MRSLLALIVSTTLCYGNNYDNAQWTPAQQEYIKTLRNHNGVAGVPCCDEADGLAPDDWGYNKDGTAWVVVEGELLDVPDYAFIVPNKLGVARVWIARGKAQQVPVYVRCFLPGDEG